MPTRREGFDSPYPLQVNVPPYQLTSVARVNIDMTTESPTGRPWEEEPIGTAIKQFEAKINELSSLVSSPEKDSQITQLLTEIGDRRSDLQEAIDVASDEPRADLLSLIDTLEILEKKALEMHS